MTLLSLTLMTLLCVAVTSAAPGKSTLANFNQLVRREYHHFSDKVEMEYRLF